VVGLRRPEVLGSAAAGRHVGSKVGKPRKRPCSSGGLNGRPNGGARRRCQIRPAGALECTPGTGSSAERSANISRHTRRRARSDGGGGAAAWVKYQGHWRPRGPGRAADSWRLARWNGPQESRARRPAAMRTPALGSSTEGAGDHQVLTECSLCRGWLPRAARHAVHVDVSRLIEVAA
jgi:hypothetical protein